MTITTKFNLGDRVWFLDRNQKAIAGSIYRADIEAKDKSMDINYYVQTNVGDAPYDCQIVNQKFCHETKEQLIESLS